MPNWCSNILVISGPQVDLDEFKRRAEIAAPDVETKLSLENFLPTCGGKDYKGEEWYDWRISNWGTKWDIQADLEGDDAQLIYIFDSAWSSPLEAIKTISVMYPELEFSIEFEECGCTFFGRYSFQDGGTVVQEDGEMEFFNCPECGEDGQISFGLSDEESCWNCGEYFTLDGGVIQRSKENCNEHGEE